MADVIEVERTDDNNKRSFSPSEITDGTLVSWVTTNDPNSDGLVRFINQSSGDFINAASIDLKGKIVKNGSLVTTTDGDPTVEWDGVDDGYEIDISTIDSIDSVTSHTISFQFDPDNLKGKPQTILEFDGLRVWKQDNEIVATIYSNSPDWRRFNSIQGNQAPPGYLENSISYKGDLYGLYAGSDQIVRWNGSSWNTEQSFNGYPDSVGIYQGDLYVGLQNGEVQKYDGNTWTNPHTASNDWYQSMVVYNGKLYLSNSSANTNNSPYVTEFDGNTWNESFLTDSTFSNDATNLYFHGLCVLEGTMYLATDSESPTEIWAYDPTNGWREQAEVATGAEGSAGNTYPGSWSIGSYNGKLFMGTQNGQLWSYDVQADTWNFQDLACSFLNGFKIWNGDMYMGGTFGFYGSDGVWKWDGSTLEKDLDDSEVNTGGFDGPFKWVNVWEGKLLTQHRYVPSLHVKGQGAEVRVPFNQSADEIGIEVGVTEGTLNLIVNGTSSSTSYDFDYDRSQLFRIGLDRGCVTAGGESNMDEPYSGSLEKLKRFPKITEAIAEAGLDGADGPNITSLRTFVENSTIGVSGNLDFGDPSVAERYRVLKASQQGGPYTELTTVRKTELSSLPASFNWQDDDASYGSTTYYKETVTTGTKTVESSEQSITLKTFPPDTSINSKTPTSISGTVSSTQDTAFYDEFEVKRSLTSGTPYNNSVTVISDPSSSENWSETGLEEGRTYYYSSQASLSSESFTSNFGNEEEVTLSGETVEDFESYSLGTERQNLNSSIPFSGGDTWFIDDEHSRTGSQSLRSNDIGNSESTSISIDLSPSNREQILINWGADSESGFDEATISKNGASVNTISGENVDDQQIFSVPSSGTTTIQIEYVKDGSVSSFSDAVYLHGVFRADVLVPEFSTSVSGSDVTVNHQIRGNDRDSDFNGFNVYLNGNKDNSSPQSRGGSYTISGVSSGTQTIGVSHLRADGIESVIMKKDVTV